MCRIVLTATAAADTIADIQKRFNVKPERCWIADPVRSELQLRVHRCTGAAGDVRSQMEVIQQLASGGPLAKSRCTLVYCAFRAQADQVGLGSSSLPFACIAAVFGELL